MPLVGAQVAAPYARTRRQVQARGPLPGGLDPRLQIVRKAKQGRAHLGIQVQIFGVDPHYFRPTEVDSLLGDPGKASLELGWSPKTKFEDLVKLMVEEDVKSLKNRLAGKVVPSGQL